MKDIQGEASYFRASKLAARTIGSRQCGKARKYANRQEGALLVIQRNPSLSTRKEGTKVPLRSLNRHSIFIISTKVENKI